jgi:hypothetical protein
MIKNTVVRLAREWSARWRSKDPGICVATHSSLTDPLNIFEIAKRFERGQRLELKEWRVVVGYAQRGAERQSYPKYRLLQAFSAAFEFREGSANDPYLDYYLGNLPFELRGYGNSYLVGATMADKVRLCCSLTLDVLAEDPKTTLWPLLPGRNLHALLSNERIGNVASLNAALRPYWGALWDAAASSGCSWRDLCD